MDNPIECCNYISNDQLAKQVFKLVGQPLLYIIKSPEMAFFDFGFGDKMMSDQNQADDWVARYTIHADCTISVLDTDTLEQCHFSAEDTNQLLQESLKGVINRNVDQIIVGEMNSLIIGIQNFLITVEPWDDDEESWRFFQPRTEEAHYVVSSRAAWVE